MDCPWDTIKMVPTPTVAGEVTSLESSQVHTSPILEHINLLDERVKAPLVAKGIGLDNGLPSRQLGSPALVGILCSPALEQFFFDDDLLEEAVLFPQVLDLVRHGCLGVVGVLRLGSFLGLLGFLRRGGLGRRGEAGGDSGNDDFGE